MRIELITIGDELLLGFTIDTNAAFLARELAEIGVEIVRRSTVGDEAASIAQAVGEALERTGAVITTGGLGPTADDKTKPAIAALFGRPLVEHPEIVEQLERRFRELGYRGRMPRANLQQAMIPEGARVLENRHGTAPGIWLEDERGRWVAMLPGVPREMRGMTVDTILPLLATRAGGSVVRSRTLRLTGIGESAVADALGELAREVEGLPVAYVPSPAGVDLRVTARASVAADADAILERAATRLRHTLAPHVYGEATEDLARTVLARAREQGLRLATAESCTGGLLGARLTAVPGASDVYVGGVVAYDDAVKIEMLDVRRETIAQHGAVSEPVAREMAAGILARLHADIGIAVTGIAGPHGGTAEKPVGLVWIAVRLGGDTRASGRVYPGDRDEVRQRAAQAALDMVRRTLAR